ncbi:MAG: hypothetical protein L0Z71_04790 [Anaerolineae bacterium]|nr:hypothetical protein [Anaerolineae bacterium]
MTLEIALKRSLFLPHFAQKGEDKTPPSGMKRIHWVGDKEPAQPGQDQNHGGKRKENKPNKREAPSVRDVRGYRELSSIMLGEVSEAHKYFANQLLPSPYPAWLATNYFCMMNLLHKRGRPPAMFGRVRTCYPSDGYIQNIQEMEIYFPQKDKAPDVVLIHADDISQDPHKPVQSYCMRVKFLASEEDIADFDEYENLFLEQGLLPEFERGYIDLLDMNEQNHSTLPWFYVIGSRWFASVPDTFRVDVREQLGKLIRWNKLIFNYHPESLPNEVKSLNRELGYKHGFTDIVLIEPETPHQTSQIVASTFEKIFFT